MSSAVSSASAAVDVAGSSPGGSKHSCERMEVGTEETLHIGLRLNNRCFLCIIWCIINVFITFFYCTEQQFVCTMGIGHFPGIMGADATKWCLKDGHIKMMCVPATWHIVDDKIYR